MSVPVIEWGSGTFRGFDPVSRSLIESTDLAELVNRMGKPRAVGLALGRRVALLKYVTLPDVAREQMASIVDLQLDQMFPVGDSGMASDFVVVGKNGTGVKAVVVAARNEILRYATDQLRSLGVKTVWMSPTALASIEAGRQAGQSPAVVVEKTADGLGFDVVVDGAVVYSRTSPMPDSSEGVEMELRRTCQTARVDELPMVGIGGLRSDLASAMLDQSSLEMLATHPPTLTLELPETKLNRFEENLKRRRSLAVLLCGAAIAALALVAVSRDDEAKKVAKNLRPLTTSVKRLNDTQAIYEKENASLQPSIQTTQRAFNPAQQPSDVLITLSQSTTPELWLTGVTFERGKPIQIRGTATTQEAVASFVQTLGANERFRDVSLVFANDGKIDETPVVLFSVQAHVNGNYPIVDKGAKKK